MNFVYMGMMQYIWEQTEEISRPGEEKKKVKNSCPNTNRCSETALFLLANTRKFWQVFPQ